MRTFSRGEIARLAYRKRVAVLILCVLVCGSAIAHGVVTLHL